jgi:hypothetical protein
MLTVMTASISLNIIILNNNGNSFTPTTPLPIVLHKLHIGSVASASLQAPFASLASGT